MNNARAIIDLRKLSTLTAMQVLLFRMFFGAKGAGFNQEKIDTFVKNRVPVDPEDAEKQPKALEQAKADVLVLEEMGFIHKKANADAATATVWVMDQYNTADLPAEQQIKKDGKTTTALTENGEIIPFYGAEVLFLHHAISPEYKAGEFVGKGKIRDFHINEIGMVYAVIEKEQSAAEVEAKKKAQLCAKRLSNLYFIGSEIPVGAKNCVKLKKNAGYEAVPVVALPDMTKGDFVLLFTSRWSEKAKHLAQIIESLKAINPDVQVVVMDTDFQVPECIKYNVTLAPTLVAINDGEEKGRIDGFPKGEDFNEQVNNLFKFAQGKTPKPKVEEPVLAGDAGSEAANGEAATAGTGAEAPKAENKSTKKHGKK